MNSSVQPGSRPPLFLASSSPRRVSLLADMGWSCIQVTPGPEHDHGCSSPAFEVLERAREKCLGTTNLPVADQGIVLAADTMGMTAKGKLIGKPVDRADAFAMLKLLSGNEHSVYTGIWGRNSNCGGEGIGGVDCSRVVFHSLSESRINAYLDTERWRGRAGAYGLQDEAWPFVAQVMGEAETVIGLPRELTTWLLGRLVGEWATEH